MDNESQKSKAFFLLMILRESKTGLACMSNEQTKKARKDWKDEAHQRGEGKERERE